MSALHDFAAYAGCCTALLLAFRRLCTPQRIPRLAALSPRDRLVFCNTLLSVVHACVLFAGSVAYLAPRFAPTRNGVLLYTFDAISPLHPTERRYTAYMLAYLAVDTVACVDVGLTPDMAAHHVLGLVTFGVIMYFDAAGLYAMNVNMVEARRRGGRCARRVLALARALTPPFQGSTPFLNVGVLLHKLGFGESRTYRFCLDTTCLLFALLRVVLQPLGLLSLWHSHHMWDAVSNRAWVFAVAMNVVFVVLNFTWFFMLMRKAARIRRSRSAAAKLGAPPDVAPGGRQKER